MVSNCCWIFISWIDDHSPVCVASLDDAIQFLFASVDIIETDCFDTFMDIGFDCYTFSHMFMIMKTIKLHCQQVHYHKYQCFLTRKCKSCLLINGTLIFTIFVLLAWGYIYIDLRLAKSSLARKAWTEPGLTELYNVEYFEM